MAGVELRCQRSELRLERPFSNANAAWHRRTILIAQLRDENGLEAYGEAAPLPGYSVDDIDGCERALRALEPTQLAELAACSTGRDVLDAVARLIPPDLPALRFALETAFLDRLGQIRREPVWRLLAMTRAAEAQSARVPVCAVLPHDDVDAARHEGRERWALGVRAFKLKIGPGTLDSTQERTLEWLRSTFGGEAELRLDANRSLDRAQLNATLQRLRAYRPEFVEEPLSNASLEELADFSIGFALDESLQGAALQHVERLLSLPSCRAAVLKPTALGGLARCLVLARHASVHSVRVIVSHSLEGRVGFAGCVQLAAILPSSERAGLWPLAHQRPAPGTAGWRLDGAVLEPGSEPGLGSRP